jgi:hypothetical protein
MSDKVLVALSPYDNILLLVNTVCCVALVYFLLYVPYQAANAAVAQGFVSATQAGFLGVSSNPMLESGHGGTTDTQFLGFSPRRLEGLGAYEYPVFWNGGSYAAVNSDQQASAQMVETNDNLPESFRVNQLHRGGFANRDSGHHITNALNVGPY